MHTGEVTITYRFTLDECVRETVSLTMGREDFIAQPPGDEAPAWTALDFQPCANCPLEGSTCPFARLLADILPRFDRYDSFTPTRVEVITSQRTICSERPLQQGLASLIGLAGAVSGCPRLAFFRPMARFHLPFASEEETLFRTFSTFLLGRYLAGGGSEMLEAGFGQLRAHYGAVETVNQGMAARIRAASAKDAMVNAIVILDIFAQAVPYVLDDALAELHYLYGNG